MLMILYASACRIGQVPCDRSDLSAMGIFDIFVTPLIMIIIVSIVSTVK